MHNKLNLSSIYTKFPRVFKLTSTVWEPLDILNKICWYHRTNRGLFAVGIYVVINLFHAYLQVGLAFFCPLCTTENHHHPIGGARNYVPFLYGTMESFCSCSCLLAAGHCRWKKKTKTEHFKAKQPGSKACKCYKRSWSSICPLLLMGGSNCT